MPAHEAARRPRAPMLGLLLLQDLDDTHIFVHAKVVDELRTQIKQFQDAITYQVPQREMYQ